MAPNQREYDRLYRARRRQQMREYLGGRCVKCGSTRELQFDHIDPTTKSFDIGMHASYAWERLLNELERCQLLCAPCHREKSVEERFPGAKRRLVEHRQRVQFDGEARRRRDERLRELVLAGWSRTAIARELGISVMRVQQLKSEFGLVQKRYGRLEARA